MKRSDLPDLPRRPGCYLFYDERGTVIYVGKAKDLRSRVSSYFGANVTEKAELITATAVRLDFLETRNEVEALILESNLIKEHRPHYNVLLKDDKSYPYLKLTNERYPTLIVTRRVIDDGGTYYGPYPSASAVRRVHDLVYSIFQLRKNSGVPLRKRERPCLRFHMGRCLAPCTYEVADETYAEVVQQVRQFLDGDTAGVIEWLKERMYEAASKQEFELASTWRDRLEALERLHEAESVVSQTDEANLDFLGLARAGDLAMVQIFQMRSGRVIGRDKRTLLHAAGWEDGDLLGRIIVDYYRHVTRVPPLILLPASGLDTVPLEAFLAEQAGRNIELRVPQRGDKVDLIELARRNAATGIDTELALLERRGEIPGLKELVRHIDLEVAPWRIEGYDISNLMGTHTVASIVVFEGGRAKKRDYRRVRIRGLDKPDDFYSMHQVLLRRFTGSLADSMPPPDLILIDGGKGQLSAAKRALQEAGVEGIRVVSLAKREERVYTDDGRELLIPMTDPGLKLLMFVRDEAHRTAVRYNRERRSKAMTTSILDPIPGIGPKRRDAILAQFSSIDELRNATQDELAGIPGVGPAAAANVVEYFRNERSNT